MSVVANCDPLFQLWKSWTVPDADSRKMAETMEPSGLYPSAASSAAFSTQKAASTGVNRATTMFETKPLKLVCKLATHELLMPPPCAGMAIPCAANQESNWGSVKKITDQRAHRWNLPPAWKFSPPSGGNAIPPTTLFQMPPETPTSKSSVNSPTLFGAAAMAEALLGSRSD